MPSAKSVFMYLVWLTLFGAWAAASAPPDGQAPPDPVAGPARRLPGRYNGFEPSVAPLQLPTTVNTPGIRAVEAAVFRVEGRGCGGIDS